MASHALDMIVDYTRRTTELTADQVRPIEHGWIFDTPSIEVAWGLNHVRLRAPMSFEDAEALADEAQAHLPFRRVTLEPGAHSLELESAFTTAGWKSEHDLLMELTRRPDRMVDTRAVVEVAEAEHLELGRTWMLEEAPQTTDHVLRSLTEFWSRESRACGDRFLGVRPPSGDGILAKAKLRADGRIAQIEDVYTVSEARGCGLGRSLVSRAVELAKAQRPELIFIVADAQDWPRHLYAQIGFEPVGELVHLQREVAVTKEPRSHRRTALRSA